MNSVIRSFERIEPPEIEEKLSIEEEAERQATHDDYEYHKWADYRLEDAYEKK